MDIERKCPFCGEIDDLGEIYLGETCQVLCPQCGATGPICYSLEDAIRRWNKREGDVIISPAATY